MSLILKSNVASKNANFPNVQQVTSTTAVWYNNYKTRVLADGGVITSEPKVKEAISFLYKNNLIGRLACCASPYYGVKKNESGEVLKLYSLDGEDLVSEVLGTGSHPVITPDGYLDINPGLTGLSTSGNRSVIRTENKVNFKKSKQIGFATVFKASDISQKYPAQTMSRWDLWGWTNEPTIETSFNRWSTESKVLGDGFTNSNTATLSQNHEPGGRGGFVLRFDADAPVDNFQLYNADVLFRKSTVIYDPNMYQWDFHLIYGGDRSPNNSTFNKGVNTLLSCMWFVDDLSEDAAIEITKFISRNYTNAVISDAI